MAGVAERARSAARGGGPLPLAARQAAWRRVWDALLRPPPAEEGDGAGAASHGAASKAGASDAG